VLMDFEFPGYVPAVAVFAQVLCGVLGFFIQCWRFGAGPIWPGSNYG